MSSTPSSLNAIRRAARAAQQLKKQTNKTRQACIEALKEYLGDKETGVVDLPLSLSKALQTLHLASDSTISLCAFIEQLQFRSWYYFELDDGRRVQFSGGENIVTGEVELTATIYTH